MFPRCAGKENYKLDELINQWYSNTPSKIRELKLKYSNVALNLKTQFQNHKFQAEIYEYRLSKR